MIYPASLMTKIAGPNLGSPGTIDTEARVVVDPPALNSNARLFLTKNKKLLAVLGVAAGGAALAHHCMKGEKTASEIEADPFEKIASGEMTAYEFEKTALLGIARGLIGGAKALGKGLAGWGGGVKNTLQKGLQNAVTAQQAKIAPGMVASKAKSFLGSGAKMTDLRQGFNTMKSFVNRAGMGSGKINQQLFNTGMKQLGTGALKTGLTYGAPIYVANSMFGG